VKLKFVAGLMLVASSAMANPFLVCDPYPVTVPNLSFMLTCDTGSYVSPADSTNALHFDLAAFPAGKHNCSIQAVSGNVKSGTVFSGFTLPLTAGAVVTNINTPANVRVVP
jgi:hypothetical protein